MMALDCKRNGELRQVIAAGHWPQAASDELAAHVKGCRSCADIVVISSAFRVAKKSAEAERPMVSPNLIWWRAQLRQRQVTMDKLSRPLLRAQVVTLVVALCVLGAIFKLVGAAHGVAAETAQLSAMLKSFAAGVGPAVLIAVAVMLGAAAMALAYAVLERE
jgi:hypothetical protein